MMKTTRAKLKAPMNPTRNRRRGQAIVEMAFVVMILMGLTMGMMQYGVIYNTNIQLTNLAREGARFAAVHGTEASVVADTRTYVRSVGKNTVISQASLSDSNIAVAYPGGAVAGSPITVTITYDMRKKFFLPINGWVGLSSPVWANKPYPATMLIE